MNTIYVLMEDTRYGRNMEAFRTYDAADKRLKEIMREYPEDQRTIEDLADMDIYLSIDEVTFKETE